MEAQRQNGFMKNLISSETKDVLIELKHVMENKIDLEECNYKSILSSITQCLQFNESENANTESNVKDNVLRGHHIFGIIKLILEHKLDFNRRLDGSRDVLKQWKKTRAYKNEEFSSKFRENGNDCLRKGQLNNALLFYNEALLFGWSYKLSKWQYNLYRKC